LVQKEKQVLQLQAEVDQYRSQNPVEDKEAVRLVILFAFFLPDTFIPNRKRKPEGKGTESNGTP
jgi:hypothetical protein